MHTTPKQEDEMRRELGLLDAAMLVAGSTIGSGIFIASSVIGRNLGGVFSALMQVFGMPTG